MSTRRTFGSVEVDLRTGAVTVETWPTREEPEPQFYTFTPAELEEALRETVRMAAEYWMTGRRDTTEKAAVAAAGEMLGRLEGER